MFYLLLALGACVVIATAVRRGSQTALALAVTLTFVFPCWMYRDAGGVRLDLRQCLSMLAIACCLLDPRVRLGGRLVLTDLLVVALAVSNVASEMANDIVTVTMMANIVIVWLLPYTIGRLLQLDAQGLRRAVPWIAGGVAFIALFAVIESITRVNITHLITGHEGSLQGNTDFRWGLRRAEGTLTHPIFFGMVLVMTLPWTIEAARRARARVAPDWYRWLPWITAGGAFFTMSRGPQLAILGTMTVVAWFRSRAWRPILTCAAIVVVLVVTLGQSAVVNLLHAWSGESKHEMVEIRGELYEYSGTTHRLLQWIVFRDAIDHAGWLGFGSTPLMSGKNRLPHVEEHLREKFSSIDNHYIEFTLRCGYLGVVLFVGLGLTAIVYLVGPALQTTGELSWFAATLAGAQLLVLLNLAAVWFATDFSFVWLFNVGIAASIRSTILGSRTATTARRAVLLPRHLCPGHPA
ncbi:MAG: O-antigen ligase family protein [Planctomycetaceae bacterium]|nr:O-antigen ligase family protein [Planctomycetaceae bacterium]